MFNNFSLFNEAKQNFTITHEYLQSYRPSNYMGKGPNLQLFCIFWSLTADISMWNFQGLKRCWSSVKKCKRIGFKPTPSVTVCARVWGDACIMFLIHPDVLQDAITLKTFRMWRKASLNVLNLSYVAVFSETNTWINGLQQRHYLLRYQHVWVEHRFEASLDRRHVVREAAGERRRDSAELERCDTTGEAWNLKSTMSGRSGGKIKSLKLSGEKENRCTTDT